MKEELSSSSLIRRIQNRHRQDTWKDIVKHMQTLLLILFLLLSISMLCQVHNRIYNSWNKPFPMNLTQFRGHLQSHFQRWEPQSFFFLHWLSWRHEFIQIELGKGIINDADKSKVRISTEYFWYKWLTYGFRHIVEPSINSTGIKLFVVFVEDEKNYDTARYPYRFESFSNHTRQCIIEEIKRFPTIFNPSLKKTIDSEDIEQIYDKNIIVFNRKIMKTCGILIGYLSTFLQDIFDITFFKRHIETNERIAKLIVSYSYTAYLSYLFIGIILCILFKYIIIRIFHAIIIIICLSQSPTYSFIQKEMRKMNIFSLKQLDDLLFNSTYENNYQDRIFILFEKYLVLFIVDFSESSTKVLKQFYNCAPFTVISIDTIMIVRKPGIICKNNGFTRFLYFPLEIKNINFNPACWLHKRLLVISDIYRQNWEQHSEKEYYDEQHQIQLKRVIEEETELLRSRYTNEFSRIQRYTTPASPAFIARFRFAGWKLVNVDLTNQDCCICFEKFRLNQGFAQWPCPTKHTFHYHCILEALRMGNKCPLCRFPVEAAILPDQQYNGGFRIFWANFLRY